MGPQTNNLQKNINRPIIPSEQFNLPINNSDRTINKASKKLLIIVIIVIVVIILSVITLFFKREYAGSGKKEDFIQFMKLYQYGDVNIKKDISLNLPDRQTYAYKILDGSSTNIDKSNYGDHLYTLFYKYSNQKNIADSLFLYKNYAQLNSNIVNLRKTFANNGEDAVRKSAEYYTKDFSNIKTDYIKVKITRIEKIINEYLSYLVLLKKLGCVEKQEISYECETKILQNPDSYSEINDISMNITENRNKIPNEYTELIVNLDRVLNEHYRAKFMDKGKKNG